MPGLGTLINIVAIIIGGFLGLAFGKKFPKNMQNTIITGNGLCVLFLAIGGVLTQMITVVNNKIEINGVTMAVICIALGSIIGEAIDIKDKLERFGIWLKKKTGNEDETKFVDAFVTSSLTICIGAMAIIGSIQDALMGDINTLVSKSILDLITIMIFTSSLGKGCIFSFISVGVFQGVITLLARFIEPIMTTSALSNLSLVGNILIFAIGLNLIRDKKIRVANMLPAIIFAVIWAFLPISI